ARSRGGRDGVHPRVAVLALAPRRGGGLSGRRDPALPDPRARRGRRAGVTRLLLCRHAEEGNAAQAELLAATLADAAVVAVYTSPLARAVDSARAVAVVHALEPIVVPALREIDLGDVTGRQFEDYPRELQTALLTSPA